MVNFIKYQHVERIFHQENEGLLNGEVFVFPKLDGANASVWYNEGKGIQAGSRNRTLTPEADNAGFCKYVYDNLNLIEFFQNPENRKFVLYGEWLVPHSIKDYRDEAWREFYVFDVLDTETNKLLSFGDYLPLVKIYALVLFPIAMIKNPNVEDLQRILKERNTYLMKDGFQGEGIVCKNYNYVNKFGRQIWGKLVSNEFKDRHIKEMGVSIINGSLLPEERVVSEFLTSAFIEKEKSKIIVAHGAEEFKKEFIGEFLGRVWYEFIREETWSFIKELKNPTINFRYLNTLVIREVKSHIGL